MGERRRQELIRKMLESIQGNVEGADIGRALIGSVDVPFQQDKMLALCTCGWEGTMLSANCESYDNGHAAWQNLAGRSGWHWYCPECKAIIWKYYHTIS